MPADVTSTVAPVQGQVLTTAELWGRLRDASPPDRHRMLGVLIEAQEMAGKCFIGDHEAHIAEQRRMIGVLGEQVEAANRSVGKSDSVTLVLVRQMIDERVDERFRRAVDALSR